MRIFSVLLWILFPGCWAVTGVTGPGAVRGPPGGSVAVRCRYQSGYEDYPKFWCQEGVWGCSNWHHIVETDGSEAEVTRGRVSIRDNHTQRVFTVTLENLTRADSGTYQCGVERPGLLNLWASVEVTVSSAVPSPSLTARTPHATKQPDLPPPTKAESSFSPTAHTTPARFQPIVICFLLLMLLKGLLFLCIVCAVIWMSVRYRRSHREMVPDRQAQELPLC
ncbi:CMRF35-like molecule 5 [Emys orbicularis]|uniref:CMRF35-like molecule 5 n=1 Tax=Emys orbicularis TaxID=82168 RepID=UPI0031FC268D